jgi:TIGR03009 family protein
MGRILSRATLIVLCLAATCVWAQEQSEQWPRTNPMRSSTEPAGPDQPVVTQNPTLQRRTAPDPSRQYSPQGQPGKQAQQLLPKERMAFPLQNQPGAQAQQQPPPKAPFTLTPQEEARLDAVLNAWEKKSKDIKTFDCSFKRWEYDPVFANPNAKPGAALHVDMGIIKYAAPDRGLYRLLYNVTPEGKKDPVEEARAEHWMCDGKSVFQYIPKQKQVVEHKLPKEMQGKAIVDGPLPFLFGAESQKLRQRYWLRLTAPPPERKAEIWLEAYPKFQADAANYYSATIGLSTKDMTPTVLQIIQPNEKNRTSYVFYDIVINDMLRLFQGDPFKVYTPSGWENIVEEAPSQPSQQAGRPAGAAR